MPHPGRAPLFVAIAVAIAPSAYAQPLPGEGTLRCLVLESDGRPIVGARLLAGGAAVAESDAEGMIVVELRAEPVTVSLELPGGQVGSPGEPVPILSGQETELIVTLSGAGSMSFDLEAPEHAIERRLSEGPAHVLRGAGVVSGPERGGPPDPRGWVRAPSPGAQGASPAGEAVTLAEVVVTAPRIQGTAFEVLQERQESASVSDVLGSDQISRAGDSDAAAALSRVTGVTVVGGRYIYVRGLGDRYSSMQLNGSSLPSPDPERRVVPLDLFPASAIAGITVQKTYSPNLPGELGGGMVQLRTTEVPEEPSLQVGVSGRVTGGSTLQTGLGYPGGGADFLGFGAGSRALPDDLRALAGRELVRAGDRFNPGLSVEELERLGEQLDPIWSATPSTLPPDLGLSVEGGGKLDLLGARAGALVAADYSNGWFLERRSYVNRSLVGGGALAATKSVDIQETQNEIAVSGVGTVAIELGEAHQLRANLGLFRISVDRAQRANGRDDDSGGEIETHVLDWTERMVSTNQLLGTHLLWPERDLRLEWRYQLALATSDQPNRRALTYLDQGGGRLFAANDGNERYYSELRDRGHEAGVDLHLPLALPGEVASKLSVGLNLDLRDREVTVQRYFFRRSSADPSSAALRVLPPNALFRAETIGPGLFELEETTRSDDNYRGEHTILAAYAMAELALSEQLSILVGARLEAAEQRVITRGVVADSASSVAAAALSRTDLLPAVTATWAFLEDMQVRAAFSQTVNRPNFRELSPGAFIDQTRGLEARGNPDLERAVIYHGDLRWEWYPGPGESLSVAAFAKYLRDPIESSLQLGANLVTRPINTAGATNLGLELEGRRGFGFLSPALEELYVAGNLTLVSSSVSLGEAVGALTSKERALQGQSPYAINVQLGWESFELGLSGTLLFNVFGERIASVGMLGIPDVFEQPQPTLDLVLAQRLGRYGLTLKLQNLLDPPVRLTQVEPATGDLLDRERHHRGRRLSLALTIDLD